MKISSKKNIAISLLLVLGIIIMPFSSFVPKAKAQSIGGGTNVSYGSSDYSSGFGGTTGGGTNVSGASSGGYNTGSGYSSGFGGGTSLSGYMTGLVPTILQLPGCKAAIGNKIKNLFSGSDATGYSAIGVGTSVNDQASGMEGPTTEDSFSQVSDEALAEANSVSTYDATANAKLDAANAKLKKIDKSTSAVDTNQNCFNAIGKAIIKLFIQRMTLSIVNWIQNGNEGNPFYIENLDKYFGDIAETEILGFGLEINNPDKYPFGKAFMQNVANSFNNKFAANAEYSLDKMIKETNPEFSAASFSADFSQGGWGAWEAMTQVPANNPLGFQLMASNELGKRLEGTSQSAAENIHDALDWGNGITGSQRCTDPWNQSKEESDAALKAGDTDNVCKNWEYVTPGSVVGHMLTKSIDDSNNSLLDAETLNDAIAAIIDAATARLSREIISSGGLADATTDNNNYNQYTSYSATTSQVENDFPAYQIAASTWLSQNPNFNIRTDLNQALVDMQRTYSDKLQAQNDRLVELNKVIYQLDYCIPGPHPGFENDTYSTLNNALGKLSAADKDTADKIASGAMTAGAALGAAVGSIVPGVGTAIGAAVGAIVGGITQWILNMNTTKRIEIYYAGLIAMMTDLRPGSGGDVDGTTATLQQVDNFMNIILDRYINLIHQIFTNNPHMPSVTQKASVQFNKINGYKKMIENNDTKITSMKSIVTKLEGIKSEIDTLNGQLAAGNLNQEQYEANLAPYIDSFGILSSELVSGDNIANVDNILKQIIDEKDYVYNNLLKGPNGCEQDLAIGDARHLPWQVFDTLRMPYPFPVLYDYNKIARGSLIPDPYNSGYQNTMALGSLPAGTFPSQGPGFLSYTHFLDNQGGFGSSYSPGSTAFVSSEFDNTTREPGVLSLFIDEFNTNVAKIVNLNDGVTSVGKTNSRYCSANWGCSGVFESVIGIY